MSAAGHGDAADTGDRRNRHLDGRGELGSAHDGRSAGRNPLPRDHHRCALGAEAFTVDGDRVLCALGNEVVDDAANPERARRTGHEGGASVG